MTGHLGTTAPVSGFVQWDSGCPSPLPFLENATHHHATRKRHPPKADHGCGWVAGSVHGEKRQATIVRTPAQAASVPSSQVWGGLSLFLSLAEAWYPRTRAGVQPPGPCGGLVSVISTRTLTSWCIVRDHPKAGV